MFGNLVRNSKLIHLQTRRTVLHHVQSLSTTTSDMTNSTGLSNMEKAMHALKIVQDDQGGKNMRMIKKREILEGHPQLKRHEMDCGSPESQIAFFTGRIKYLQDHMELHPKDKSSKRGFLQLIQDRQKVLTYLKRTNPEKHLAVTSELGIRIRQSLDTPPAHKKSKKGKKAAAKRSKRR